MPAAPYSARDPTPRLPAGSAQDEAYLDAVARHGPDMARFVAGYERDQPRRQELLQEVHVALWRSLAGFRGQCSLRTWVYRVAHHIGSTHVQRSLRSPDRQCLSLEEIESLPGADSGIESAELRLDVARVYALIHRLQPADREVMLLYLEDLDAATIGEVTGLSARNVATKVHRIKRALAVQLNPKEVKT